MTILNHEIVISAATDLVRDEGWPRLSIRALAAHLNVTPMALYRYYPNSDALGLGAISKITESIADVRGSGDAFADLAAWASQAHAALVPYPGAAAYLLTTWFKVPPVLRAIERLLDLVVTAGIRGFEAVAAVNAVFTYVLMRSEAEHTVRDAGVVRRSLEVAAEGDYPRLSALVEHYNTAQLDMHFAYGLQVLIEGIANRTAGTPDRRE